MKITVYGTEYEVRPTFGAYSANNGLAIQLIYFDDEMDGWFPFATLTVCLPDAFGTENEPMDTEGLQNCAFVDINNCPWAVDFITDNNIADFTGIWGNSGYCQYPLFKFHNDFIANNQ